MLAFGFGRSPFVGTRIPYSHLLLIFIGSHRDTVHNLFLTYGQWVLYYRRRQWALSAT